MFLIKTFGQIEILKFIICDITVLHIIYVKLYPENSLLSDCNPFTNCVQSFVKYLLHYTLRYHWLYHQEAGNRCVGTTPTLCFNNSCNFRPFFHCRIIISIHNSVLKKRCENALGILEVESGIWKMFFLGGVAWFHLSLQPLWAHVRE